LHQPNTHDEVAVCSPAKETVAASWITSDDKGGQIAFWTSRDGLWQQSNPMRECSFYTVVSDANALATSAVPTVQPDHRSVREIEQSDKVPYRAIRLIPSLALNRVAKQHDVAWRRRLDLCWQIY
jgi:hypothetical protein